MDTAGGCASVCYRSSVMTWTIKRLGPGDEGVLTILAEEDADFDLEGRSGPQEPLAPGPAKEFLANPAVLLWIASEGSTVVGFLYCVVVPLRLGAGRELLLYEIGVRSEWRRRGVGRTLLTGMEEWMRANEIGEVWVCADNQVAVDFYRGCGFSADEAQPIYLTRVVS